MGKRTLKGFITLILALILIGMVFPGLSVSMADPGSNEWLPLGTLDAYIVGKVKNGTSGIQVECVTIYNPDPPANPTQRKFYTNTTADGEFNVTVDSDTWDSGQLRLDPYTVNIYPTYYLEPVKQSYTLSNNIFSGNTSRVPDGMLEVRPYPTSNLTITVLNGSSGEPLENARVELEYEQEDFPDVPFPTANSTDMIGQVYYPKVRSVNTTINASKTNFRYLSDTTDRDWIEVPEGGQASISVILQEKRWPFNIELADTDVNVSEDIVVDFKRVMDESSILNEDNYVLKHVGTGSEIDLDLVAGPSDMTVEIDPLEDLEYNETYSLRLDTTLMDDMGRRPLWRAMTRTFITELPPGSVRGIILDSQNMEPIPGISVQFTDQIVKTNGTGHFLFPLVPKGNYRIDVLESYLYNSTSIPDVDVAKNQTVDLGEIGLDGKQWSSLEVTVLSGGKPLEGAWVQIVDPLVEIGDFRLISDTEGKVYFERVRTGMVSIRIGAPYHISDLDAALVSEDSTAYITVELEEVEIPVEIEPTLTNPDGSVDPGSNFLIRLPEPVVFSTLDVRLWELDNEGNRTEEVTLTSPQDGGNDVTFLVDPPSDLPKETDFEMLLDDGLNSLANGTAILWRNLSYFFRTPDFDMSHINGTILFENKPLEGLEVTFGPFSVLTDDEGSFNMTVDLSTPSISDAVEVNGTRYGYNDLSLEKTMGPGEVFDIGTKVLFPLTDWYTTDPVYGDTNVEPGTTIVLDFKVPFVPFGNEGNWSKHVSILKNGSNAPVTGTYEVSNGNKTLTISPTNSLDENQLYRIIIDDELLQEGGLSMFPVMNSTPFTVRPPAIVVEMLAPDTGDLSSLPLDRALFHFDLGFDVDQDLFEGSISVEPEPHKEPVVKWISGSEITVRLFLEPSSEYTLSIPAGIYGKEGEPLISSFELQFTTGEGYADEHNIDELVFSSEPSQGWLPGSDLLISGKADGSEHYTIRVVITGEGYENEWTTTVSENGNWNITLIVPDQEGTYQLEISLFSPGGPVGELLQYDVEISSRASKTDDESDSDPTMIILAIVIVVIVVIAVILGLLYMKRQGRKAEEKLSSVEITEVESEWDEE